jgi:Family of unknown function (DUF6130)
MRRPVAWALLPVSAAVAIAAFVVPPRLFGPQLASGARPSSTASLAIVHPGSGDIVEGSSVEVRLRLTGGDLVAAASSQLRPDEGHVHVWLDGSLLSMTSTVEQPVDIGGLDPGEHTIRAEFVAADHGPFNPRVVDAVTFRKS